MPSLLRPAAAAALAIGLSAACDPVAGVDAPDAALTPGPGPGLRARFTVTPGDVTRDRIAQFGFAAPGAASFRCLLDDEPMADCVSPASTPELGDGTHTFAVIAVDDAGVEDASPPVRRWRIDTAVSELAIDDGPPVATNQDEVTFRFSAAEAAVFRCRLDAELAAPCGDVAPARTGTVTVTARGEGVHSFFVTAVDVVGNQTEVSRTWALDTTPPTVQINAGPNPNGTIAQRQPTFAFSTGAGATTTTCRHDPDVAPVPCAAIFTPPPLADGPRTVTVVASDAAGNVATASRSFTVDASGPVITIGARPPSSTTATTASVGWTTDELATFTCSLDGGTPIRCGSGTQGSRAAAGLAVGEHAITITATDTLDNTADVTVRWSVVRP
jgi:hypothetical protein